MLNLDWDKRYDILYIRISDTSNSYGDEVENGLVILRDMEDETITGVTIFDFVKRYNAGTLESLKIPININFDKDVYPRVQTYLQ
ncbi:hypothetical conserved protein [Firmicutes bacterium CAG:238]|jgi:hypothetical protein|nr:hypothetical conserved protein [Firmicutes bacterium CAG:238]